MPRDEDEKLSPEQLEAFLRAIERIEKRRRIELLGYAVALVVMLAGTVAALVAYGRASRGTFVGWVFLLPLGVTGLVLWLFGRWANRVAPRRARPPGTPPA